MPIRHCQKCGLKVLIDESQAGANPFYCQRCTTAMKSSDQPEAAPSSNTPVRKEVPSAVLSAPPMAASPTPPPMSAGSPARATVKVLCPYCKASFNGRVPQKPARGACPVCQKELILLPNGDIRPSAGFDVAKWQDEPKAAPAPAPAPEPVEAPPPVAAGGNTRLLIKKYSAEPAATAPASAKADGGTRILSSKQAEPTPVPVAESPAEQAKLPDWLDDRTPKPIKAHKPSTEELIRTKEQQRDPAATETPEDSLPPAQDPFPPPLEEPDEPLPPPKPKITVKPTALRQKAVAAPPPPVEAPEPEPEPIPAARPAGRKPTVRRAVPPPPAPVAAGEATGTGKVFVAWAILLLPLLACPVLYNMRDKFKGTPVEKAGAMFRKGWFELSKKLVPPPPPPKPPPPPPEEKKVELPPEAPPKPDPDQQKKDEQKISHIYGEVLAKERELKAAGVAASPEQKQSQERLRETIDGKKAEIKRLQEMYQKMYNKPYDPANP